MQTASGPLGISAWFTERSGKDSWSCRHQHTRWFALCLARYDFRLPVDAKVILVNWLCWDGMLQQASLLARDVPVSWQVSKYNLDFEVMHVVTAETVLSLLRNPDYCVYGDGGTKNPRGLDGAEDAFNEVVMQERGKFKEETLVNVGGRSRRSSMK